MRSERLDQAVAALQSAITSGMVPNALFISAKDTINREVERQAEAFLATGPHVVGRDGRPHHQSDWWLAAYDADAFVSGTHGIPTALKRATKVAGLREYAEFIKTELLPVHAAVQEAKPLIVKRGDLPKVRSPREIADDAKRMTCQCCGRRIFAETGTIAHHGYERPGTGWQTASCMGAKELPFEVSRDALGRMIEGLRNNLASQVAARKKVAAETVPLMYSYAEGRETKSLPLTRATFTAQIATLPRRPSFYGPDATFDGYKGRDLAARDDRITRMRRFIKECQTRYDGWKQTHRREGDAWVNV